MFVPETFALNDPAAVAACLDDYSFGLLVTAAAGSPQATHLPFLIDRERGPQGTLIGHMARANPHWRDFAGLAEQHDKALVVFQGPHGYVSPRWYRPGPAVPTWNYIAVHAYGTPRVLGQPGDVRNMLARLVERHEMAAGTGWSLADQDNGFLERMMRAIVAFEIPIGRLEAKAKLNQNKSPEDRHQVIAGLESQDTAAAADLAAAMRKICL